MVRDRVVISIRSCILVYVLYIYIYIYIFKIKEEEKKHYRNELMRSSSYLLYLCIMSWSQGNSSIQGGGCWFPRGELSHEHCYEQTFKFVVVSSKLGIRDHCSVLTVPFVIITISEHVSCNIEVLSLV